MDSHVLRLRSPGGQPRSRLRPLAVYKPSFSFNNNEDEGQALLGPVGAPRQAAARCPQPPPVPARRRRDVAPSSGDGAKQTKHQQQQQDPWDGDRDSASSAGCCCGAVALPTLPWARTSPQPQPLPPQAEQAQAPLQPHKHTGRAMNTQGIFSPPLSGEPPPRTPPRTTPPPPQQQRLPGRGPGGPGGSGGRGDAVHRGPPHGQPPPPWACEPAAAWSPPSRPGAEPAAGGATRRSSEQCDEQDQDGVRKMLEAPRRKELPPLPPLPSTPLRRRILVRPKPDIPTYFRLSPADATASPAATAVAPMDRFNKFRFGGRDDRERERQGAAKAGPAHAASAAGRTARTSDKTERLRELTERLKGGSAPPTPAPTPSPSPTPTPAPACPPGPPGPPGPRGAEGPPSAAAAVGPAASAGLALPADGPAKEDDLFDLRLARPESRAIIGSYIQRTIPFRSASFSQVDFSDGKYFRHPTARAAAAWLKPLTAATLPRKKTSPSDDLSPASSIAAVDQPSGSTPSLGTESAVDSAVGSDEGCLGSMGSVGPVGPPRVATKPPGSRSMTHPLSSRGVSRTGSRDHADDGFPAGNGLSGEDADEASRPDSGAMLSVVADARLTNSCSSLSDAATPCPEASAEAAEAAEAVEAAQHADLGAAPETPPCDGSLSPPDIKPLDNPVSYEVFVRQFPNYKEYEKWMNESVLVNNNSDSTAEWQANLNNTLNNNINNTNNNMEADSDERKVCEAIKSLSAAGPAPLEHDDRCINNFDPSTCPKCLEQMETGPSILQKLKASFHMEDMELEPHEKELYSRHTDILLRKWTGPAAKAKHPFERSKSEPKETSKEDKACPKLLEPAPFQRTKSTDEAEAALQPPRISLPAEEECAPEARTASSADPDELKRRRPKDEPRRWLERPKLICQSSDERDDEGSAGSAPLRPRFPMLGRSDSLSEGESDQGDRRPSTPSRASPSLYSHLDLSDSEGRAGHHAPPSAASNSRSPHTPRRYSKRPLRGPYGQMLEAEMKKPEANRKLSQYTEDLKFLEEFSNKAAGSSQSLVVAATFPVPLGTPSAELTRSVSSGEQRQGAAPRNRHQGNLSMDDSQLRAAAQADRLDPAHPAARPADRAPKRKVSAADLSSLHPGGGAAAGSALPVCHQRTTSSPSQLEGISTRHHADADLFRRQPSATAEDPAKRTSKDTRTHVVVELYETERNYVDALDFLVKEYMQPLKRSENAGMVDSELVEQIFYQVPAILCHHREFLEDLQKRLENWDFHQKVGDVLLNAFTKRSVIDTYTAFINNWKTAKEAIKSTCQAKPAFARYLEAMSREHKGRLALDSLLIKPVQRIPRYELLIARLLKHTDPSHADHSQLLDAQREIHELAVKINCTERESLEQEQQQQTLRDLEALVDGCDLVAQGRVFLRHDCVTLASNTGQGQGTRKERVLFLFSDLVVIARTKRNIRKPSAAGSSTSVASGLEGNRYRCSMKAALDDLEIVKAKDESLRRVMREMEQLSEDVAALTQITELASSLHLPHAPQQPPPPQQQQQQQQLEELARELLSSACRQLAERQNSDSQLSCLDLTVNTSNGVENITVIFTKPDKRSSWEETFNEAKTRLALSADRRPSPKFKTSVPIRKTRAGLQFTCAAPTLAGPGCAGAAPATGAGAAPGVSPGAAAGLRDVWVCNSDGYVGQVCVLSLVPEPNVTSCNGVCNARILCVAAIPATPPATAPSSTSPSLSCPSQLTNSKAGISISVEDTDQAARNLHLDSSSSSDEFDDDNDSGSAPEERLRSNTADSQASAPPVPAASHVAGPGVAPSNGNADAPPGAPGAGAGGGAAAAPASASSTSSDDGLAQPTMWLGTEDGCIHVYSCNDNIRIKRNKVKIQHGAAVHCIMYFDNRVFVSLANGDITVYSRDQAGGWSTSDPYTVAVGSAACPVTRMVPIAGRLWCSCQHTIKVLNTHTLQVEQTVVAADSNRSVTCFVVSGLAVWLSVQNSAVLKLYHASTFEHLGEVNVAPAVTKMLASCDDIIRQHKAACLRVTSLLACKDLLWIGTSAGVILTMPLPHVAPGTTRLTTSPNVSGVPHGHTGHVRFLTVVEAVPGATGPAAPQHGAHHNRHSWKHKGDQAGPGGAHKLLVISGGDGYEDFRTSSVSEVAGKEDSTNHLLMWQV